MYAENSGDFATPSGHAEEAVSFPNSKEEGKVGPTSSEGRRAHNGAGARALQKLSRGGAIKTFVWEGTP